MSKKLMFCLLVTCPGWVYAAAAEDGEGFELGQVEVSAKAISGISTDEDVINASTIRKFDSDNIAQSLNHLPGVNIDFIGGRNETGLRVRGFDSRQVPIFLDGIPQYVPYDGYVDFARFLTSNLSEIRLAKSGASLLYGANTLGGAINLVTQKPRQPFEFKGSTGITSAGEKKQSVNIGGTNGLFYAQGSFAYINSPKFRLPKHFKDPKAQQTDGGHYRENAQFVDRDYGFKLGITPENGDEYAIGYNVIRADKSQPVYVGHDPKSRVKYWRWPKWDKDSYYFLSNTHLSANNSLKVRLFTDTYKNTLNMYRDDRYHELSEEPSTYHDRTTGGSINLVNTSLDNQLWQFSYQYRRDKHDDYEAADKLYKDATQVLAAEHKIHFAPQWQLRWGVSQEKQYSRYLPKKFKPSSTSSTNGLAELSYQVTPQQMIYGNVSVKSRFPTMKDRYSHRMGRALPNEDLKAEKANNFELGWQGRLWMGNNSQVSVFYTRLRDEIQSAYVPDVYNQCRKGDVRGYCTQYQNIGKTRHLGLEFSLDQQIGQQYQIGFNYTYLQRKNLSDPDTPLLNTPRHKVFAYVQYQPTEKLNFLTSIQAEKGRRISYSGRYRTLGGFGRIDTKATWQPAKNWQLEAGIQNMTDKNYEFSDGYPMAGRTWFANLRYDL